MPLKTFIRWYGNKTKHINKIKDYLPTEYNTYIEPFLGSGAMFLYLQPEKWIINDYNKDLVDSWKLVKIDPDLLISFLESIGKVFVPMNNDNKKKFCQELANELNDMKDGTLKTCLFIFLKYCAFMGKIVLNDKYYFTGLNNNIKKINYYYNEKNYNNIKNISNYLKESKGKIYNTDYKEILKKAKSGDFVFLDPPYIENYNYGFKYNTDEKLNNNFQRELLNELKKMDKKGAKWLMTQSDTKENRELFRI